MLLPFCNVIARKRIQYTTGTFVKKVTVAHKSGMLFHEMSLQELSLGGYSYLFIQVILSLSHFHLIN
jgi:hypothetical protein